MRSDVSLLLAFAAALVGAGGGTAWAQAQRVGGCPTLTLADQTCWLQRPSAPTPEGLFAGEVRSELGPVDLDGDGVEEQTATLSRPEMGRAAVLVLLRRGPGGWTASVEDSSMQEPDEASWSNVIAVGARRLAHRYRAECGRRPRPVVHHTIYYATRGGAVQRVAFDSECRLVFPQATTRPDGSIEFTHWTSPPRARRVRSLVLQWDAATERFTAGAWQAARDAPPRAS